MKKKALNLTLHPGIRQLAEKIMRKRSYGSLSTLVEELIRERYDQVCGDEELVRAAKAILDRNVASLQKRAASQKRESAEPGSRASAQAEADPSQTIQSGVPSTSAPRKPSKT